MRREIDFEGAIERTLHKENGDSHTELHPDVFHPSGIAPCHRQAFIRKLGLDSQDTTSLGVFKVGTLMHEWMEDEVSKELPDSVEQETPIEYVADNGIKFKGHADGFDPVGEVVYDFKSTSKQAYGGEDSYPDDFDGVKEDYLNQLHVYMKALGVKRAKLVWMNKKDFAVRTYPETEGEFIEFDEERWQKILDKADMIRDEVKQIVDKVGLADDPEPGQEYKLDIEALQDDGLPFSKCGDDDCWSCKRYERLIEALRDDEE